MGKGFYDQSQWKGPFYDKREVEVTIYDRRYKTERKDTIKVPTQELNRIEKEIEHLPDALAGEAFEENVLAYLNQIMGDLEEIGWEEEVMNFEPIDSKINPMPKPYVKTSEFDLIEGNNMKLIMENWRNFISEETASGLKEFYHGTCFPMESFTKGITTGRAKGFGQGSGFYVFSDKINAVEHAKSITSDDGPSKEEDCPPSASPIVIVIDPPLTSENFDIDYELATGNFIKFMIKHPDQFKGKVVTFDGHPWKVKTIVDRGVSIRGGATGRKRRFFGLTSTTAAHAPFFSNLANLFAKENPKMFRQFEEEILENIKVLKYNGKETIYPLRIEDLKGEVLWRRK